MKEENITDESNTVASPTPRKERRAAMSKLVREMAPFCFIYNVVFSNLAEQHELMVGKNLIGKVSIDLADL